MGSTKAVSVRFQLHSHEQNNSEKKNEFVDVDIEQSIRLYVFSSKTQYRVENEGRINLIGEIEELFKKLRL